MALKNQNPTKTSAWKNLETSYQEIKNLDMKKLFNLNTNRKENYTLKHDDFTVDYSKNRINDEGITSIIGISKRS